jgi:hypothetical protein
MLIFFLGYPPADHSMQDYLTTAGSKDIAYDRASAFLEALFKHTTDTLCAADSSLDYIRFMREFRSRMTEGQKMTRHNKFWEDFYNQVIEKAKQLETQWVHNICARLFTRLRCSGMHRASSQGSRLLKAKCLMIHPIPHLHEVRTSPPILLFENSLYSFRPRKMSPCHPAPLELRPKGSRLLSYKIVLPLSFSCSTKRIQQPNNIRLPAKTGPYSMSFATHFGGYMASHCSRSSCQPLAKFLNSHPPSRRIFRREWSRAN